MAHPVGNEHRSDKVQKDRVGKITKGYASGGGVRDDGMPMPRAKGGQVKTPERMSGGSVKARADKVSRAKGGRVRGSKGHKTNVNVIVAPSGGNKPPMAGVGMPPPPIGAAPPMPPKPPMMPPAPGGMGTVPGAGGMPPPPIRADGGRAFKKGGAVKMSGEKKHGKKDKPFKMRASGGAVSDSSQGGTQVQHSGNKSDGQNIGRGPVITRASGGPISTPKRESEDAARTTREMLERRGVVTPARATGGPIYSEGAKGKQMAWLKGNGAGGGKARLAKAARKGGHEPWLKDAAS